MKTFYSLYEQKLVIRHSVKKYDLQYFIFFLPFYTYDIAVINYVRLLKNTTRPTVMFFVLIRQTKVSPKEKFSLKALCNSL